MTGISTAVQTDGALTLEWFAAPPATVGVDAVVCTGVFDVLHIGHARFLQAAASGGATLLVGVEDDARVRSRKGPVRPLVPAVERAELLALLTPVDGVFIIHGPAELWTAEAYAELLRDLRPAALALTVGDPAEPGKGRAASMLGAGIVRVALVEHRSTSALMERARGAEWANR